VTGSVQGNGFDDTEIRRVPRMGLERGWLE
jgi:hypothetical protein